MSDFDRFINGPITVGDVTETVRMWREEYASARRCGLTALHYACSCQSGDIEVVVWVLLDRGCDIEAVTDDNDGTRGINGWRPLHICALKNNRGAMRVLLEAGCCLTALTPDGETALHWACKSTSDDSEAVVRELVEAGCDIEAEINVGLLRGLRPLHVCALMGNRDAMRVLLEAGCCLTALTPGGETPLQIAERGNHHECASMLRTAVQTKEVSNLLELLKYNSLSKLVEPETGKTLLDKLLISKDQRALEAIKSKQVDEQEIKEWKSLKLNQVDSQTLQLLHECLMYRCIIQKYDYGVYSLCTAEIVNKASLFMGSTALETAVASGAVVWVHEILRKLVEVDESWIAAEDIAQKNNFLDIQELISKRKNYFNRKKGKGISRLHIAVIENDPDMVKYLINKGLVGADETHKNLGSALSLAYSIDNIDCVKNLQASNSNVNTIDRFMQTPLHVAICNKTEDLCEYLVENTKDMKHMDIFGLTALAQSVLNDCRDICERLVRKGAICEKYVENMPQLLKFDPELRIALSNIPRMPITNHETIYSLCLKSNRTIYPCLLESLYPSSVNRPDGNNNSLLHISAVSLMPDLCSTLISKSADVNLKNDSECTPLLELLKQYSKGDINEIEARVIETVNVLIDGGASLDVEDEYGCSVLEMATLYHSEKLLMALIHNCEHIDRIKKTQFLAWLYKKHFIVIREVIPLINKGLLSEWITRELIIDRLADEEMSLATRMYDHGTHEVKTGVVEKMLYRASFVGDKALFARIIKDDISLNSSLDGGESLLNCLIKERKREFIQLVIRSRNGPWFMEKKNMLNQLPLHVCIDDDYLDVTDQLIVEMSSVNEQDNNGNTALSLLLSKISEAEDNITIERLMTSVKLLINKSADLYLVNWLDRTVVSYCTNSDIKLEIELFFRRHQLRQETVVQPQPPYADQAESTNVCSICEDEPRNCALNCGHVLCMTCADRTIDCYVCRRRITDRRKLFV